MKEILIFASILVPAITIGMTQLQAARHSISMSANVGGVCTIGTPTALNGFTSGTSLIATATGGKADAKTASITLPYSCSSSGVSVQLTSANQGITKPITGPLPGGQTNKIHYVARFNIGSGMVLGTLNTASVTVIPAVNLVDNPSGDLHLDVEITSGIPSPNTLIAGNYADSLHVDIGPNP